MPPGPNVARELRQGGAGADLRGSAEDRARRRAVRVLLHEPARGDQHRRPARRRRSASRRSSRNVTPSPGGQYVLVSKIKKPFSHTDSDERLPAGRRDLDARGRAREEDRRPAVARRRRRSPASSRDRAATSWRADQPATIVWVEALDGGDLKNKVPFRDKVVSLAAPFTGAAGRGREDRMALRRHLLHRQRHRAADRERSRHRAARAPGSSSRARRRARCGIASRTRPTTTRARR